MGIYTVYNDPRIDAQIDEYLSLVVGRVLSKIDKDDIQAIVLAGGFGRGEGGVVVDNGSFKLVNDLDISIFPEGNLNHFKYNYSKMLNKIAEELTHEIPIKQVDLGIGDKKRFLIRLFKIAYTVNAYEFIYGHKILYGNINLGRYRIFYKSSKIPLIEGAKYFYTRGSGMLIPAVIFKRPLVKKDELLKQTFFIETNKAILAMGDSFLILKSKYHFSYKRRREIALYLDFLDAPHGEIIKAEYLKALNWKLRPEFNWRGQDYHMKRWFEVQKLFSVYFLWYESIRLKNCFPNWLEYSRCLVEHKKRPFINTILKTDYFLEKLTIMPLILFSIRPDMGVYLEYLEEGVKNLNRYRPIMTDYTWDDAAIAYLRFWHPEGIIQQL